jgi:hypothetical protein
MIQGGYMHILFTQPRTGLFTIAYNLHIDTDIMLLNTGLVLSRTITALWKNRKLSPEQQMELVANVEAVDKKYLEGERQADDAESFVGMEEAHMSQVCSFEIPLTVS